MIMKRLLITLFMLVVFLGYSSILAGEITKPRQQEIKKFVQEECTLCHGENLEGDIGPPLQNYNLRLIPNDYIAEYIRIGRPGTKMRSWISQFTEEDLHWLVLWLKRERVNWNHTVTNEGRGCSRTKHNC